MGSAQCDVRRQPGSRHCWSYLTHQKTQVQQTRGEAVSDPSVRGSWGRTQETTENRKRVCRICCILSKEKVYIVITMMWLCTALVAVVMKFWLLNIREEFRDLNDSDKVEKIIRGMSALKREVG